MHTKEGIEKVIREAVKDVTGITIQKRSDSLIGKELSILPADFLYIFELLEKRLQISAHDIFEMYSFEIMTVENLTNAIFKLDECSRHADLSC